MPIKSGYPNPKGPKREAGILAINKGGREEPPKSLFPKGEKPSQKVKIQNFRKEEKGKIPLKNEMEKPVLFPPNNADRALIKMRHGL